MSTFKVLLTQIVILVAGIAAMTTAKNAFAEVVLPTTAISGGFEHINGQSITTNNDDMQTTLVPISLTKKQDNLTFGVTFSHIEIKANKIHEQGLGDTWLSVGYDVSSSLKINLVEKIATGDKDRLLSTGKNDTAVAVELKMPTFNRKTTVYARLGYNFTGKRSDLNTQDSSSLSLGSIYKLENNSKLGIYLDYRQSLFADLDNQLGLSAKIDKPLNQTYSLSAFAGYDNTETGRIGVSLIGKF